MEVPSPPAPGNVPVAPPALWPDTSPGREELARLQGQLRDEQRSRQDFEERLGRLERPPRERDERADGNEALLRRLAMLETTCVTLQRKLDAVTQELPTQVTCRSLEEQLRKESRIRQEAIDAAGAAFARQLAELRADRATLANTVDTYNKNFTAIQQEAHATNQRLGAVAQQVQQLSATQQQGAAALQAFETKASTQASSLELAALSSSLQAQLAQQQTLLIAQQGEVDAFRADATLRLGMLAEKLALQDMRLSAGTAGHAQDPLAATLNGSVRVGGLGARAAPSPGQGSAFAPGTPTSGAGSFCYSGGATRGALDASRRRGSPSRFAAPAEASAMPYGGMTGMQPGMQLPGSSGSYVPAAGLRPGEYVYPDARPQPRRPSLDRRPAAFPQYQQMQPQLQPQMQAAAPGSAPPGFPSYGGVAVPPSMQFEWQRAAGGVPPANGLPPRSQSFNVC